MMFKFYKYQGAGNDFIIIDNREKSINLNNMQIKQLCDRHFGIGADGLMILNNHHTLDFNMQYFNSDGNESTMCGNGGRCMVAFAKKLGIIENQTTFHAVDGDHKAIIKTDGSISLKMLDVLMVSKANEGYFLNTGSPHFVCFKDNIEEINVYNRGKEIRYSQEFMPEGANVNFVQILEDEIFVRTYERGVENETLSCGTGVTASAICTSIHTNSDKNSYQVKTLGGKLKVEFTKEDSKKYTNIWLSGPATFVFEGEISI